MVLKSEVLNVNCTINIVVHSPYIKIQPIILKRERNLFALIDL